MSSHWKDCVHWYHRPTSKILQKNIQKLSILYEKRKKSGKQNGPGGPLEIIISFHFEKKASQNSEGSN